MYWYFLYISRVQLIIGRRTTLNDLYEWLWFVCRKTGDILLYAITCCACLCELWGCVVTVFAFRTFARFARQPICKRMRCAHKNRTEIDLWPSIIVATHYSFSTSHSNRTHARLCVHIFACEMSHKRYLSYTTIAKIFSCCILKFVYKVIAWILILWHVSFVEFFALYFSHLKFKREVHIINQFRYIQAGLCCLLGVYKIYHTIICHMVCMYNIVYSRHTALRNIFAYKLSMRVFPEIVVCVWAVWAVWPCQIYIIRISY